ncbi:hypothetical protein KORDIASMS9_01665 [Kordia sp. SMS9]|uniref:DUF3472 domain-containing protein n=1 Tax=Kordia sp. SMS9 TaxID=2282170 RepID=UPI000E105D37|nr:hypothetical protein [Kordia sp. SMS9]AXG69443.1 hypothetical protein KORDIASMS9_01665 [Kordia sp. SMS9]
MKSSKSNLQKSGKKSSAKLILHVLFLTVVLCCLSSNHAIAQQQKWASQYVHWNFEDTIKDVWNVDQQVWIATPNSASFWPIQWDWVDSGGVGGYLGLQEQSNGSTNVRFSLWNATASKGAKCRKFDGEGIGETCELSINIDTTKFYRYRVWRLDTDKDGQWWGGWLIEANEQGVLKEHFIGKIKVPLQYSKIDIHSISNFVEFFGLNISPCDQVPLSLVGFTPPAVNYKGKGAYSAYSTYKGSTKASGNICANGTENDGAIVTPFNYNFGFAKGVAVFLGGKKNEQKKSNIPKSPKDMPDN